MLCRFIVARSVALTFIDVFAFHASKHCPSLLLFWPLQQIRLDVLALSRHKDAGYKPAQITVIQPIS